MIHPYAIGDVFHVLCPDILHPDQVREIISTLRSTPHLASNKIDDLREWQMGLEQDVSLIIANRSTLLQHQSTCQFIE